MEATLDAVACDDNVPDNVATLDRLRRGELAAIASYELALGRMSSGLRRGVLLQCRRSHLHRARVLDDLVRRYGGVPSRNAGPWGWLVRVVEASAALLGEDAAVRALYRGETRGLRIYRHALETLTGSAHAEVRRELLPEQHATASALADLLRAG